MESSQISRPQFMLTFPENTRSYRGRTSPLTARDTLEQSSAISNNRFRTRGKDTDDISVAILRNYLNSDSDDEALAHLQSLSDQALNVIKCHVFVGARLQTVSAEDAADTFIQQQPRSQVVQAAVAHLISSLEIAQRTPTPVADFSDSRPTSTFSNEENENPVSTNFFTSLSNFFCSWLCDVANWFCRFFNINDTENEEELELSLHDEVTGMINMIEDVNSDPEVVSASLLLLFERFPSFKNEIISSLIAMSADNQIYVLDEDFDINSYLDTNSSANLLQVLRTYQSDLQRSI